jgi:uncharacterized cupredoxin-like copper-binding protein
MKRALSLAPAISRVDGGLNMRKAVAIVAIAGIGSSLPPPALAHGDAHTAKPAAAAPTVTAFGRSGDPRKVSRTVAIEMSDAMRFTPAELEVKQGETVRFVVTNAGRLTHELVLGTMQDLRAHAELMRKFPNMEHAEDYMVHVAPGTSGEIVWQFTQPGNFHFGCLVAGHFEAGMVGVVRVVRK